MPLTKFIISIGLCLLAGFIGSFFTTPSIPTWYASLHKPSFNPPNWVFGPVWTMLFILMGMALYLVWVKGPTTIVLVFFAIQLLLNILWSILFFGLRNPFLAFVEIVILWVAILLTIITFYGISKPAGFLLIPYILWVSFAAALNLSIALLNA